MGESKENGKVLECKASDNEYLHKDFHSGLCYAIRYVDDHFGPEATREYLQQVGETFYAPLTEALRAEGLPALEKHWRAVFTKEQGSFSLAYEGDALVLTVDECPAVAHLHKIECFYTERFCESTVLVNETVCRRAGYRCSCAYQPGQGKCVQKFWKDTE